MASGKHGGPLQISLERARSLCAVGPLLFLASGASDFYTGHILYADGGYTAG